MAKTTIGFDNLISEIKDDKGLILTSGTAYTQGMVVTSIDGINYTNADIILSTIAGFNTQTIFVLADDYDATAADVSAIGYTGVFNENNVTLPGTQTLAQVGGVLQAKDIILKDWSK